ncbi:MAG: hypothetical protein ACK5JF_11170 [Oscillospiraceae bacterium]
MSLVLALISIGVFSLFFARWLRYSSALMPLTVISAAIIWFMLGGMVNMLPLFGWIWYVAAALALGFVVYKERRAIYKLFTPGLIFFLLAGLAFAVLFCVTRPMLTQWDEFTFWGIAGKITVNENQLYTIARGNIGATSYPPGLIVFSYMTQFFFSSFREYAFIASYTFIYMAAFSAASALLDKRRTAAVIMLFTLVAFPFLFEATRPSGISYSYLSTMADGSLAALFGGALCLYFAGGKKGARLLIPFSIVLAALTAVKDIGLALALVAWVVACLDIVFCERKTLGFGPLRRWKASVASILLGLLAILASFFSWWLYLKTVDIDRGNIGAGGQSYSMVEMMLQGIMALFGVRKDEFFSHQLGQMIDAFFKRPVWMLGSGFSMLILILVISALAFVLSQKGEARRRVVVCTAGMAAGFGVFYIFNVFVYTYILQGGEAQILKDYDRYIYPYWFGWLMLALVLLAAAGIKAGRKALVARGGSILLACALLGLCVVKVDPAANFASVSPSVYTARINVQQVAQTVMQQGMRPQDKVYLLSQGDDAFRFYLFAYELPAELEYLYGGKDRPNGTTAAALIPPGEDSAYVEKVPTTSKELEEFLHSTGCTHILLDITDTYTLQMLRPLAEDGLPDWSGDGVYAEGGLRYYALSWQDGQLTLVAPKEVQQDVA